jgi:hypothetical protein
MPGRSLASKPTWPNTSGCSATSFFLLSVAQQGVGYQGQTPMDKVREVIARQIAQGASTLLSAKEGAPLPLTVFKNSLREWQARWRAEHLRQGNLPGPRSLELDQAQCEDRWRDDGGRG